jgi:hypothetical protein
MPLIEVTEITNISRQSVSVVYDQIDPALSVTAVPSTDSGMLRISPGGTESIESSRLQAVERLQQLGLIRVVTRNVAASRSSSSTVSDSETLTPTIIEDLDDATYGPWSNISFESMQSVDGNKGSTPFGSGIGGKQLTVNFDFNGSKFGLLGINQFPPGLSGVFSTTPPITAEELSQLTKVSFNDTFGFKFEALDSSSGFSANTLFFRGFKPTFPRPSITEISFSITWEITATPTFEIDKADLTFQYGP